MNNIFIKSGLILGFISIVIFLIYTVYEFVQYQQGMDNDRINALKTIKDFENKYNNYVKMMNAIIAQNKENTKTIEKISAEDQNIVSKFKDKNEVVQNRIDEINAILTEHGIEINKLESDLEVLDKQIIRSKELQSRMKTIQKSNEKLFLEVVFVSNKVTETNSEIWKTLFDLYNKYLQRDKDINTLKYNSKLTNNIKMLLVKKRIEFKELIRGYIQEVSVLNQDIMNLNFDIDTQLDRFSELEDKVKSNTDNIAVLYDNYNGNKEDIQRLQEELQEANVSRDQLVNKVDLLLDQYTTDDSVNLKNVLKNLQTLLDEVQIFIDVCKEAIQILESANVVILQDINDLQTRIESINLAISTLKGKYDSFDIKVTELNTNNTSATNNLNTISNRYDDTKSRIDTLTNEYSEFASELNSLKEGDAQMVRQVNELRDNYTANVESNMLNIDKNMKTLFNFHQNGSVVSASLNNQEFTDNNAVFDFNSHLIANNGMTINTGNSSSQNQKLSVCKKDSDQICLHLGMGDEEFNIMPHNVNQVIINDKNNNGIAKFDMTNNAIFMGGVDDNAALIVRNNVAYAKVTDSFIDTFAKPSVVGSQFQNIPGTSDSYVAFTSTTPGTQYMVFKRDMICDILIVGGGGSGAYCFDSSPGVNAGGGGGAGAVVYIENATIPKSTKLNITVGKGGIIDKNAGINASGKNGENSSIVSTDGNINIFAAGGEGGKNDRGGHAGQGDKNKSSFGKFNGKVYISTGGRHFYAYPKNKKIDNSWVFAGVGGGGGAGEKGESRGIGQSGWNAWWPSEVGGKGGDGVEIAITGVSKHYGGGGAGGGGYWHSATPPTPKGGLGGGAGDNIIVNEFKHSPGMPWGNFNFIKNKAEPNTGGGGAGASHATKHVVPGNDEKYNGASGIVIVRIKKNETPFTILPSDISVVKGYGVKGLVDGNKEKNQTPEKCRQLALKNNYKAWGFRNNDHPDPSYKNTCFFYNNNIKDYYGNYSDDVHEIGCLRPGEKVEWGCSTTRNRNLNQPPEGFQKGLCNNGYYDATRGRLTWWGCGKNCPGGIYRTDVWCNCGCLPNSTDPPVHLLDK